MDYTRGSLARRKSTGFAAVLLLAPACNAQPPKLGQPIPAGATLVIIGSAASARQWQALSDGAVSEANNYPPLSIRPMRIDVARGMTLKQAVGDTLASQPTVIAVQVDDPEADRGAVQTAASSCPTISFGFATSGTSVYAHVDTGVFRGAEMLGDQLASYGGDARGYLLLHQGEGAGVNKQIYQRYKLGAERGAAPVLLDEESVGSADNTGMAAQRMLARFPHTRLVVNLVHDPRSQQGLLESLPASVRFATLGAWPELWPALRAQRALALVGPLDREIGKVLVQVAADTMMHGRPSGFSRSVEPRLVTLKDLDGFERDYAGAAGRPSSPELIFP